jgi:hypothetical protein
MKATTNNELRPNFGRDSKANRWWIQTSMFSLVKELQYRDLISIAENLSS